MIEKHQLRLPLTYFENMAIIIHEKYHEVSIFHFSSFNGLSDDQKKSFSVILGDL